MPQLAVHGLIAGWACMVSQACPQPSTSTAPPPDTTPHFPRSLKQLTRGNGQDEMRAAPPWCLPSCCTHANLDPSSPTNSSPVAVAAAHTHTQPLPLPFNNPPVATGRMRWVLRRVMLSVTLPPSISTWRPMAARMEMS